MQAWNVFLDGNLIDTVWFQDDLNQDWILDALINHDHYDPDINVAKDL